MQFRSVQPKMQFNLLCKGTDLHLNNVFTAVNISEDYFVKIGFLNETFIFKYFLLDSKNKFFHKLKPCLKLTNLLNAIQVGRT